MPSSYLARVCLKNIHWAENASFETCLSRLFWAINPIIPPKRALSQHSKSAIFISSNVFQTRSSAKLPTSKPNARWCEVSNGDKAGFYAIIFILGEFRETEGYPHFKQTKKMLKIQFIAISLFINLVTGVCQNKAAEPVKGTRLILELPKEFKEDSSIPGFISEIDSSIIFISEIENPYSFEELIQKRISNSLALGVDTSDFIKFMYDGYMAVQFNTYIPVTNQNGFTVNFGSDKFLIDISIEASKEKIKELKNIVLSGKYDKSLEINSDFLLGFTASFEGTNLSLFKKDAHTINTKEKDKLGNVVSWLNLTRMPKSSYEGLNASEAIDVTYSLYNFNKNYTHTDSLEIDNSKLLWKVYTQDRVTFTEYNIIGVIQKKEFDLLIMGGVNNKEKLSKIYGVLKSIKFNSTR